VAVGVCLDDRDEAGAAGAILEPADVQGKPVEVDLSPDAQPFAQGDLGGGRRAGGSMAQGKTNSSRSRRPPNLRLIVM